MEASRMSLKFPREQRTEAVDHYAGNRWSEQTSKKKVLLNILSLYVSIVGRSLVAKNPRFLLSTFAQEQRPAVDAMQQWMNEKVEQMDLAGTLKRIVLDALFSVGIGKVCLATPADAAFANWGLSAGQPYVARVDLDDFVYDVHARDFSEASYIAHRYRAPLASVQDSKLYNSKQRKNLSASRDNPINAQGDERVHMKGRTYYAVDEEFEDMVDLWEVYLPRHQVILTLADDNLSGASPPTEYDEPLRGQNWLGIETGPYMFLGFNTVPGNAMPKGPIMDLLDAHLSLNNYLRKVDRQARRLKVNTIVPHGTDAKKMLEADDGDVLDLANPQGIVSLVSGGANQGLIALITMMKDMVSWMAGNLDIMGGLSPQSKTATQDTMLNQNSTRSLADMQDSTITFASKVGKAMGWYWWNHPTEVMETEYKLPGPSGLGAPLHVTPAHRMGKMPQIKVDPYSMQHATPQSRLQALNNVVSQFLQAAQLAQQQGTVLDWNYYFRKMADYMDDPDIIELLTVQSPPTEGQTVGSGGVPTKPPETTRNYVRESMPGRTEKGNSLNLMNAMMGVDGGGNPEANGKLAPTVGGM